ncbi:uncharacterized protein LOC125071388 [Vanessa atalanta]|uniref:uncharacterized protein LOC125071388 n=1 Tax=Vanessa atalanta TaxID=42275 RepID=UPI001FCD52A3|nr:uncharacterized protein LOC125071388 [Vanessa atalanta]
MDIDKENIRMKVKSKIPLPTEPLPPIPQNVLKRQQETENERHPLKTINQQSNNIVNNAGPSHKNEKVEKIKTKIKCPVKINARHVTVRQNTEDLDWDYKVFKDESIQDCSVIVISDDECALDESKHKELRYFNDNRQKNCLGETKKAATPALKSPTLEPNKVRNIKRSLKRPHSRELQGLSPKVKYEKGDERHRRRLFHERLQDNLQSPDSLKKSYMKCLNRDYTADLFTYLLNVENRTVLPRIPNITRACVINWLIKVNGSDGNPAVIQSAIWYLDSILAVGHVQLEKLQLVAAACYWIAQKIHGQAVTAKRLVRFASHAFTTGNLLAAEKAVLYKLKFPSQPVVPQEFITYLSWWCDNLHPGEIEVAATFVCISGLMIDKVLCNECPSVIGAAAVRNAVLLLRKKEAMVKLQTNPVFKAAVKKTSNISYVCSVQRRGVRLISTPLYEYKAPLEYYGTPPHYVAQKIISSANELAIIDTRVVPA